MVSHLCKTALCFCIYNFQDFYIDATAIVNSMVGWESYVLNRPQIPGFLLNGSRLGTHIKEYIKRHIPTKDINLHK